MYTKHLENIGESFVKATLLEEGMLVSKPSFDQFGADLIVFTSVDDRAKVGRIQCKYRELKSRTSVVIDSSYVTGAFVLFLYLKTSDGKVLLCFLPKDIRRHFTKTNHQSKKMFRLEITSKTVANLIQKFNRRFTSSKIPEIYDLIRKSSPDLEIQRMLKGLVHRSKEIKTIRDKRDKLKKITHELEVIDIEKKAAKEQLEILQEYRRYMELHEDGQK